MFLACHQMQWLPVVFPSSRLIITFCPSKMSSIGKRLQCDFMKVIFSIGNMGFTRLWHSAMVTKPNVYLHTYLCILPIKKKEKKTYHSSGELVNLLDILHNISPERVESLRKQVSFIWTRYLSTPGKIALTALQIINDRYWNDSSVLLVCSA